jgi:hypothetical protein
MNIIHDLRMIVIAILVTSIVTFVGYQLGSLTLGFYMGVLIAIGLAFIFLINNLLLYFYGFPYSRSTK